MARPTSSTNPAPPHLTTGKEAHHPATARTRFRRSSIRGARVPSSGQRDQFNERQEQNLSRDGGRGDISHGHPSRSNISRRYFRASAAGYSREGPGRFGSF